MKYIVVGTQNGPYGTDERPTFEDIKNFGEGEYVLRKEDGTISKTFTVLVNRNGNLRVIGTDPEGLDAISTLNLNRMVRDYARIVKCWPASASAKDYKRVIAEVQARAALVAAVGQRAA